MARQNKSRPTARNDTAANLGFEAKLWAAADALRNNMDAAEYRALNIFWVPPAGNANFAWVQGEHGNLIGGGV